MPALLTEVFRGFPQSLQANVETVSRLVHGRFLQKLLQFTFTNHSKSFQFIIHIHESSYHSVLYDLNPRAACDPLDFPRVNSTNEK
jgi:hypothetical protein